MDMDGLHWAHSFEEIEKIIEKYISDLGDKLDHVKITWFENEWHFQLELHPEPSEGVRPMPGDGLNWTLTPIAYISKYKDESCCYDNLDLVREAGRKLYFQLRKKYPVKRNLGVN